VAGTAGGGDLGGGVEGLEGGGVSVVWVGVDTVGGGEVEEFDGEGEEGGGGEVTEEVGEVAEGVVEAIFLWISPNNDNVLLQFHYQIWMIRIIQHHIIPEHNPIPKKVFLKANEVNTVKFSQFWQPQKKPNWTKPGLATNLQESLLKRWHLTSSENPIHKEKKKKKTKQNPFRKPFCQQNPDRETKDFEQWSDQQQSLVTTVWATAVPPRSPKCSKTQ
jgi:hypothetical protein